jgi:hypothetical protein
MSKMYTCNKHSSEKGRIPIRGQAVRHTRHGLEAWNSKRLWYYEDFRSLREANNYIQKYIDAGEIKHFFRDFYIINDDIVAVLDVKEDVIVVITYYGSIKQNPMLRNLDVYLLNKKNKRKYGKLYLEAV